MWITSTDSTNNHLKRLLQEQPNLPEFFTISADYQTAGRGQAGNGWESEEGKNLLFTTLFRLHDIPVSSQFLLSQLVPLAIVNILQNYADCKIKWPNDIYYGDKKIAGILIEHSLAGNHLEWSIAGIGLNVNQLAFKSNAPNPISLAQITGREFDRQALLNNIIKEFQSLRPLLHRPEELKSLYIAHLYRYGDFYPFVEVIPTTDPVMPTTSLKNAFYAKINDILHNGQLILELQNGEKRQYHFKEIRYVIS